MEVIQRNDVEAFVAPDGAIIRELAASRNSSARNQSLAEAIVAPGEAITEHYHLRTEELYYILAGEGIMTIEGEQRTVGPGDTVVIPPRTRHKIANAADAPLVLLACCAPEWSAEDQVLAE
jgi:mannose-6-phosphate isomerase-like protein (cupin superfamily)